MKKLGLSASMRRRAGLRILRALSDAYGAMILGTGLFQVRGRGGRGKGGTGLSAVTRLLAIEARQDHGPVRLFAKT